MIVICHFVLAVVYLYDGEYHRRQFVNQTSYVCGTLWMVTAVYELINMPKEQNFIYTVFRIERLADSFIKEVQTEPNIIIMLIIIMIPGLYLFVLEWCLWNYPANYIEEDSSEIFPFIIGSLVAPLWQFVIMSIVDVIDAIDGKAHYAVNTVCIFLVIVTAMVAYRVCRQICTIDQDIRKYFLLL